MSSRVTLNPLTEEDAQVLDRELCQKDDVGEYQWFGFKEHGHWARRYHVDGLLGKLDGELGIYVDDKLAGVIDFRRQTWGPSETSWCWEIGITLLSAYRSRGIGPASLIAVSRYLFANSRANRVQASTDESNSAAQRALDKAGFHLEGTVRQAQWRAGDWHDLLLYSILRSELPLRIGLASNTELV